MLTRKCRILEYIPWRYTHLYSGVITLGDINQRTRTGRCYNYDSCRVRQQQKSALYSGPRTSSASSDLCDPMASHDFLGKSFSRKELTNALAQEYVSLRRCLDGPFVPVKVPSYISIFPTIQIMAVLI